MASKTHKDRVHEFNAKLESLSEHHDIPKVRGLVHKFVLIHADAVLRRLGRVDVSCFVRPSLCSVASVMCFWNLVVHVVLVTA